MNVSDETGNGVFFNMFGIRTQTKVKKKITLQLFDRSFGIMCVLKYIVFLKKYKLFEKCVRFFFINFLYKIKLYSSLI